MSTIRIRQRIESETLHVPELKPLIGRTVEIVIDDNPAAPIVKASAADWDAVLAASQQLEDYDYQAQVDQVACDLRDAYLRIRCGTGLVLTGNN